jgi:hypothetical protein
MYPPHDFDQGYGDQSVITGVVAGKFAMLDQNASIRMYKA